MQSPRWPLLLTVVALACLTPGCATKFVAKKVNPLRPVATPGWDPGEISNASRKRIAALGVSGGWRKTPELVLAQLEMAAPRDTVARRAIVELAILEGMRLHGKFLTNRGASGYYLCAIEHAVDGESQGGSEFAAFCRHAKRYAVARLAGLRDTALQKGVKLSPEVPGPTRQYRVRIRTDVPGAVLPDQYRTLLAADRFKVVGARELALVEGVGTPLVGQVKGPRGGEAAREFRLEDGLWMPLTAIVEPGPKAPVREMVFTIYDRKAVETANIRGRRETLAGDFSTPFAVQTRELNQQNFLTLGLLGYLRGDRFFDSTGLYPIETPRTDKIPVIFVHGLISAPNDWRFLHNALLADKEVRERYQFWAFYYPTSMTVPWSSAIFRQELDHARKLLNPQGRHAPLGEMVLIGHSMGGLLSRMQISDSHPDYYANYFTRGIDQLRLTQTERETIQRMFFFKANQDISKVVFICVPHRGSGLATNWMGRIGRALAQLPYSVLTTTANVLTLNADALAADVTLRPGTSIDSLNPGGKFVTALQKLPMSPSVQKHSIIGNRGSRGPLEKSSDGVVPYWSSHLPGVPETIIPSGHGGLEHPLAELKVRELLKEKLRR